MSKLKTNMRLSVSIFDTVLHVAHKDGFINAMDLLQIGNQTRSQKGQQFLQKAQIMRMAQFVELHDAVKEQVLSGSYSYFELDPEKLVINSGSGRNTKTMLFLPLAIEFAGIMSPYFRAELYKVFIEERLLQNRDEGGYDFKRLNISIDKYLSGREHKKTNKGIFITIAKMLKAKIFSADAIKQASEAKVNLWNEATPSELLLRISFENDLINLLRLGVVRDWDHLKELIEKL